MPASTEPRSGLVYGWDFFDNHKPEMDANLLQIGRVGLHLSVLDRNLTSPPGSPSDGATYIVAAGASGAWTGLSGRVVVWDDVGAAWVDYTPRIGWIAYIEDEQVLSAYKAGGWSAGIAI